MSGEIGRYSDDAAQTDPTKDGLAVSPFAKRLAEHLRDTEAPNGYVIGLSGEWGSGKTSVLNYTRGYLEQIAPQREGETASIVVMDFKPWLVSGHQDLVGAFFKVLSEELGRNPPRWKAVVADAAEIGKHLAGAISTIGWITSHVGGVVAAAGATAARAGLTKLAERWSKQPSLQSVHDELRDILKYSATTYVVVIDDIDRLQPGEIQDIMMMVKTVGQLPNVVYLLSYDRNVVWPALQRGTSAATRVNFAEKLVQQEIALPTPGFDRLVAMLLDQAAFLAIDRQSERWGELAEVALRRWLRTPRDVVRLANNMRFAWPVMQDHMEPIEYLAIEGVRTFDKALFDWLRDGAFYLFGSKRHSYDPDGSYREAQAFKASLSLSEREAIIDLVCYFFPRLRGYFDFDSKGEAESNKGKAITVPVNASIVDRRGIGHAPIYDAYFGFYVPSGVVGRAVLAEFLANVEDIRRTHRALKNDLDTNAVAGSRQTSPLIEAVTGRMEVDALVASVPLLRAALRLFSDLADGRTGREAWERRDLAWALVRRLTERVKHDRVLATLCEPDDHVSLYAMTLIALNVRDHTTTLPLNMDDRLSLLAWVRELVQRAADDGRLGELPSLHAALIIWPEDTNWTVSRTWLAAHMDEPWLLPRLRLLFLHTIRRDDDRATFIVEPWISEVFDIGHLKQAISDYLESEGEDLDQVFTRMLAAIDVYQAKQEPEIGVATTNSDESL